MFYAVYKGKEGNAIYETWAQCQKNTSGVKGGCKFKSFKTREEAENFIEQCSINNIKEYKNGEELEYPALFVDGSVKVENENPIPGYGFVIVNDKEQIIDEGYGEMTEFISSRNVSGEIKAAIVGIESCINLGIKEVNLYHDYNGIGLWGTNQWNASVPIGKWYIDELKKLKDKIKINFIHVKGHTGIKWNEYADRLAAKGSHFDVDIEKLK